jgi:hypothetical protein
MKKMLIIFKEIFTKVILRKKKPRFQNLPQVHSLQKKTGLIKKERERTLITFPKN